VSYLAGIHDLAYCFSRVGGAADSGVRQDWVGLGANIGALAGKAVWYAKGQSAALKTALEATGKKILPTPTAIIDVTMVAVVVIDLMNGFGAPDSGSGFSSGVDKLKIVDGKLELAIPDSRDWSGSAADAYAAQNAALRALVANMQELDKKMQTLVANHGAQVKQAHQTLAILGFALVASQGIALCLYMIPIVGFEISFLFQVVAALAATTTVVVQETLVLARSMNAADDAAVVATEYAELGKSAELGGSFAKIEVKGAEEATVGSFTAISDGLSSFSAARAPVAAPSVASLAGMSQDSSTQNNLALMSAFTEEYGTPSAPLADGTPDTPDLPPVADPGATPAAPAFTLPTMADVNRVTAQAAQVSANVAQPMNVVNQTMGSVQQIVSTAQQGGAGAAPGTGDAALAGAYDENPAPAEVAHDGEATEDESTGAASGTDGERAPVEGGAVAHGPASEPGQHVL
jgi:hypothetical protein